MKGPKLVRIDLYQPITNLVIKTDHRTLGIWARDCAKRVLPYFEEKYPNDNRPRKALETLQEWIDTGIFKMIVIRKASLDAHAAARNTNDNVARSAARSAGQAVATAHVPTHALGAAIYAATAIRDATPETTKERDWQYQHLLKLKKTFGKNTKNLWRSQEKVK